MISLPRTLVSFVKAAAIHQASADSYTRYEIKIKNNMTGNYKSTGSTYNTKYTF